MFSGIGKIFAVFACLGLLSGCSEKKKNKKLRLKQIILQVDDRMNNGRSMPVDLVFVYDTGLMEKLSNISAKDYFHNLDRILVHNPYAISIHRFEPIPGQMSISYNVEQAELRCSKKKKLVGVLVFSLYNNEKGSHRIDLTNYSKAFITFGPNFESVTPHKVLDAHMRYKNVEPSSAIASPRALKPFKDYSEIVKYTE